MSSSGPSTDVAARLASIRREIAAACERSGRSPEEVTLVGASKFQPLDRLREAFDAGLRAFGENRVQEGQAKRPQLPDEIEWHLIGPLQSNKVRAAAETFHVFGAVGRMKIARALGEEGRRLERSMPCLLEVNLGDEDSKHGFSPRGLREALPELAELAADGALELRGLMAIPPFSDDPEASRPWFRRLRELRDETAAAEALAGVGFAGWLSMGMSHDFAVAVEEGATHVRVGSSLFGSRQR